MVAEFRARRDRDGKQGRYSGRIYSRMRETVLSLVWRPGGAQSHGTEEEVLLGQMSVGFLEV